MNAPPKDSVADRQVLQQFAFGIGVDLFSGGNQVVCQNAAPAESANVLRQASNTQNVTRARPDLAAFRLRLERCHWPALSFGPCSA